MQSRTGLQKSCQMLGSVFSISITKLNLCHSLSPRQQKQPEASSFLSLRTPEPSRILFLPSKLQLNLGLICFNSENCQLIPFRSLSESPA